MVFLAFALARASGHETFTGGAAPALPKMSASLFSKRPAWLGIHWLHQKPWCQKEKDLKIFFVVQNWKTAEISVFIFSKLFVWHSSTFSTDECQTRKRWG